MNQDYRTLFGIDGDTDIVGKCPEDLLPEDIAEQFREIDQRVLTTNDSDTVEERIETEHGLRTFLTRMNPV
jgi:PAS domain-containing protein